MITDGNIVMYNMIPRYFIFKKKHIVLKLFEDYKYKSYSILLLSNNN